MKKLFLHLTFCFLFIHGFTQTTKEFYNTISSGSTSDLEQLKLKLTKVSSTKNSAYLGALFMKEANLLKTPSEKFQAFKHGKGLLESAIALEPNNAEFRFLRFLIQENAPEALNYHSDLHKDANLVVEKYDNFSPELKKIIMDYSKKSSILKI